LAIRIGTIELTARLTDGGSILWTAGQRDVVPRFHIRWPIRIDAEKGE
jgi:hypothetical protein